MLFEAGSFWIVQCMYIYPVDPTIMGPFPNFLPCEVDVLAGCCTGWGSIPEDQVLSKLLEIGAG